MAPRLGLSGVVQRLPQAGQEIGGSGGSTAKEPRVGCSVQPAGPGVGGQAAGICPRVGPPTRTGVLRRVCRTELPVKDGVGPGDAERVLEGLPQGRVGCRRRRLRDVADLPGGTGGPGDALRAGRSGRHYGLALGLDQSGIYGVAAPANPSCGLGSGGPWSSAVMNCREAWREITVAQGSQPTGSVPSGCGPPGGASPARNCGPSGAGTWTAASPATTCPTLPRAQPWRLGLRGWVQVAH